MSSERCACGLPLHYTTPEIEAYVRRHIAEQGEYVRLTVGDRTWLVQRHYIALHGVKAAELPELAKKLGFKEVTGAKA